MASPRGCFECNYCKEVHRQPFARDEFYCDHPDRAYMNAYCHLHRMVKAPGFIAFSAPSKRRQRYCPLGKDGDGDG